MRHLFCWIAFIAYSSIATASAESIYLTTSRPLPDAKFGSNGTYTFMMPYFTRVNTKVAVSISKAASTSNNNSGGSDTKAVSPTILYAVWDKTNKLITYSISCDLSRVLKVNYPITINNMPTGFGGDKIIAAVTSTDISVKAPDDIEPQRITATGGTIGDVQCPSSGASSAPGTFSLTLSVTAVPNWGSRAYLYLRGNPFFSDSANNTVGTDGMLTGSDTSSTQQVTAILQELAATVAPFLTGEAALESREKLKTAAPVREADDRQICLDAIGEFLKAGPYNNAAILPESKFENHAWSWPIPIGGPHSTLLLFQLKPYVLSEGQENIPEQQEGLLAFFPVPASAEIRCRSAASRPAILVSAPTVVNLFTESHFLNPQRDFLTSPQDTLTFSGGIITGHKFTSQSSAKTVVDTVTAPIRAIMPSVTVTKSTQVQSSGGKVTGTTDTTSTQTAPSKGP